MVVGVGVCGLGCVGAGMGWNVVVFGVCWLGCFCGKGCVHWELELVCCGLVWGCVWRLVVVGLCCCSGLVVLVLCCFRFCGGGCGYWLVWCRVFWCVRVGVLVGMDGGCV